jgi:hypothetical protein
MNVTPDPSEWRNLYAAALFENDQSKITKRVAEAESAMMSRSESLLSASNSDRREAIELDQSLRMLQLLKTCLETPPGSQSVA